MIIHMMYHLKMATATKPIWVDSHLHHFPEGSHPAMMDPRGKGEGLTPGTKDLCCLLQEGRAMSSSQEVMRVGFMVLSSPLKDRSLTSAPVAQCTEDLKIQMS